MNIKKRTNNERNAIINSQIKLLFSDLNKRIEMITTSTFCCCCCFPTKQIADFIFMVSDFFLLLLHIFFSRMLVESIIENHSKILFNQIHTSNRNKYNRRLKRVFYRFCYKNYFFFWLCLRFNCKKEKI